MSELFIYQLEDARDLPLPGYETEGAAGVDLYAAVDNSQGEIIKPGERKLIPTGVKIKLEADCEGQIRPRSGLAIKNGVTLLNTPGTIDFDYRGEIKVIMINLGSENFEVKRGMRIAQLIVNKIQRPTIKPVISDEELGKSRRGSGGFGHTGEF